MSASPRCLVPMANRPLVTYALRALKKAGATDVSLCANGDTAKLKRTFLDDQYEGMRLHYVEDSMPRGPAGCVKDAAQAMGGGEIVAIEGALLPDFDIEKLLAIHRDSEATLTAGISRPARGESSNPRMIGVYAFNHACLSYVSGKGYQDIKEGLIPRLYKAGQQVQTCELQGQGPRVTGPESYLAINNWVVRQLADERFAPDGYERRGEQFIHPTARIAEDAQLVGPMVIGPDSVIKSKAVLIGPVSIGAGCTIGEEATLCSAVLWDKVKVGMSAHVDESILANGVIVAGGSQVSRNIRSAANNPMPNLGLGSFARHLPCRLPNLDFLRRRPTPATRLREAI